MHSLKQAESITAQVWTHSKRPLHAGLFSQLLFSFLQIAIAHGDAWHTEHVAPVSHAPLLGSLPPAPLVVKPVAEDGAP